MPPIFGICNTTLQQPDPGMINRLKGAAQYILPRQIEALDVSGGYLASMIVSENPLADGRVSTAVNESWTIVADASLYKREELWKEMGGEGERERWGDRGKEGDAALILGAWMKWGETCVQYLYGDFAFVIFNAETGEVFCGRDHLGVRPLFYTWCNESFIFASELRLIMGALQEKFPIPSEYLMDTLVTVKSDKHQTPFEHIFRLMPAHTMHAVEGAIQTRQYWQANPDKTIRLSLEKDYVQLFREKLTKAVTMRCRGVSKPGSELSGGLDSSAVTGIAADYASKNNLSFKAFSNIFPKDSGIDFKDEREFISAMCEFMSLDYTGVERLNRDLPELLQYAVDIQGCYIQQNFSIFSQALYEAAGDQNIQVMLSGFGGDELVSARIRMPWNELIQNFDAGVIVDELFYKRITLKSLMIPLLIAGRYFRTRLFKSKYTSGVFTPELLDRRFANLPLQQPFADKHALRKRMGDRYRKLARDITSWKQYDRIMLDHVPQRMEYCYAAAAQYGLEYRYPLLDIELIETALAFPPWLKQHHGINRYVFRQAIKGFVPEKIRLRDDKSGSTIPQTYFSLVNEREEILKIVKDASNSTFLNEIFDLSKFPEWYERLVRRDPKDMNYLMPGAFYGYLMMLIYYGREE